MVFLWTVWRKCGRLSLLRYRMRCYIPLLVCPLETYKPKSFFFFMVFFHFPGWKPNLPPILFRVPKLSNPCRGQLNLFLPCRSGLRSKTGPPNHMSIMVPKKEPIFQIVCCYLSENFLIPSFFLPLYSGCSPPTGQQSFVLWPHL